MVVALFLYFVCRPCAGFIGSISMMNHIQVMGRYVNAFLIMWDEDKGCMIFVRYLNWKHTPSEYEHE